MKPPRPLAVLLAAVIGAGGLGALPSPSAVASTAPVVETDVHTVLVNWGSHVDPAQGAAAAGVLDALDNSGYLRGLAADYGLQARAAYLGAGVVPDAGLPSTVDASTIAAALRQRIGVGALPSPTGATDYVVVLTPGVTPAGSGSSGQPFCSSHGAFTVGARRAYVIVVADYTDTAQQCAPGVSGPASAASVNVSRQLVNAITDPDANGTGVTQNSTGQEVGTACAPGALGNVDGFPVQAWWSNTTAGCSVGRVGVAVALDGDRVTNARAATLRLHDTEVTSAQPGFSCTFDTAASPCDTSHPVALTGIVAGSHVFRVVVDNVGEATASWLVDLTAPTAGVRSPSPPVKVARTLTVAYTAHDTGGAGVSAYDVRYRAAAWNTAFHRWVQPAGWQATRATNVAFALAPGHTYCFSVRAHDAAGNVSAWSTARCTTVPLDDVAMAASSGWRRMSSPGAFHHTLSLASSGAAVLRLDKAHLRRLALVVRTCPGCGRIKVYRGGVLWRTVTTRSARVRNRVVLTLPDIGLRTTSVRLRPAGGAPVYVDGIALMPV